MLEIQNITKSYPGPRGVVRALDGISLRVGPGEFVAVRGPSGSGKTTLLLVAGGMLHPDEGRVLAAGHDVYRLPSEARSRLRARAIGFVFQQFHLIPYLTVFENILAPVLAQPNSGARMRAQDLIARLGLEQRRDHRPSELSSGERQRCALARALLHKPGFVLADEPTGNLDDHNGAIVLDFLSEYAASGRALLLVTHEARAAERAHRVVQLEAVVRTP
ncbi:MAG: ABC transporter ATP-binding protein [Planctomycetes bacterium]|nr:ABC transporter ATP-binding protein [Planctomycetota bacterium]